MKIAILTLPLHTNYGGILQAYALQTVLERMGHQVVHLQPFVEYPPLHSSWKMPLVWGKRFLKKYIDGEMGYPVFADPRKWVRQHTDAFIASYIYLKYLKSDEWNPISVQDYDTIIFGSDQIWRPIYAIPIEKYFGSFLEGSSIKRIAYAASFGTEENEYTVDQIKQCANLLSQFSAVSVRESLAVSICKERFGINAVQMLDPTMLLDVDDYKYLFEKSNSSKCTGNLAVYVLDENTQTNVFVEKISKEKLLNPIRINSKVENSDAPLTERVQFPLEQWLRAFNDVEFVITDSFHACVFSILFHKPFICIGNKDRGTSRFHSLLKMFGLTNRMVDIINYNQSEMSDIDWTFVDSILSQKRVEAKLFLETTLL